MCMLAEGAEHPVRMSTPDSVQLLAHPTCSAQAATVSGRVDLPIPYSLPPMKFTQQDTPWTVDGEHEGADVNGLDIDGMPVEDADLFGYVQPLGI